MFSKLVRKAKSLLRLVRESEEFEKIPAVIERLGRFASVDSRVNMAFARAAATASSRQVDPNNPLSWEFGGFSQHGEDGIIDYLASRLVEHNRFFVEIGAADGLENCSSWLALGRSWGGVMIDANEHLSEACSRAMVRAYSVAVWCECMSAERAAKLVERIPYKSPDVFILDIDSVDWYVMTTLLENGLRPKIVCVEYNSAFGPELRVTIPECATFDRWAAHPSGLYYGVSIAAWKSLFGRFGYRFISVESTGCNAFFVREDEFQPDAFAGIEGVEFLDNIGDVNGATRQRKDDSGVMIVPPRNWVEQLEMIRGCQLVEVQ